MLLSSNSFIVRGEGWGEGAERTVVVSDVESGGASHGTKCRSSRYPERFPLTQPSPPS
jgi:hypothetical protein